MLNILNHPLITHKLSLIRRKETGTKDFRENLDEMAGLMAYEITKDEVYEINDVYYTSGGDVYISFTGNNGERTNKNVNMENHGFDKYFKIT